MTEEKKGIVRMLAITFVVMLAIPLAYRVWITFNPPAPRERLVMSQSWGWRSRISTALVLDSIAA